LWQMRVWDVGGEVSWLSGGIPRRSPIRENENPAWPTAGCAAPRKTLVDWSQYLAPTIAQLLPFDRHRAMQAIGVIEIVAGLVVAFTPRIGGYLVAVWLAGIIVNLLLLPGYF